MRSKLVAATLTALLACTTARAECKLGKLAELPVTMNGLRPLIPLTVDGREALFMVDSGAFYSLMSQAGADRLKLHVGPLPPGFYISGTGGTAQVGVAIVKSLGIAGQTLKGVEFMVGGSDVLGSAAVGVVGQNILRAADVEYDFAGGAVRLMREHDCGKLSMAYWAGDKAVGVEDLHSADALNPHTRGAVTVNGVRLQAMFDTGAPTSMLTLAAARRIGVRTNGPGVEPAGLTGGIGRGTVRTWITPVDKFEIGGEEVRHTKLRIADTDLAASDMLIGADFFLSHHVYVASERRLMFFTYNGGPVFDLSRHRDDEDAPEPTASAVTATAPQDAAKAEKLDAGELARRAMASAARRDLAAADADLSRAIALDPKSVVYLRQRALVRLEQRRPALAQSDLDGALQLAPGDGDALLLRAELRLSEGDRPSASADLDAAVKALPDKGRLDVAHLYTELDRFADAVQQYDRWITLHPDDGGLAAARNGRCWARALGGLQLDAALADCNAAIRMGSGAAQFLDSRGLVRLRRGEYAPAIADYDAALAFNPKMAWSLYGRGVARIKTGKAEEGKADLAAAAAIAPKLAKRAEKLGIGP